MSGSSARMLQLLSLLQTHRYWPGGELASRLEVSPRTLRRDVDRLRELGYPVGAVRGLAGGYQLRAGTALPPLLLDDEEAVAIAVGLRAAAGGMVAGIEETSVRALSKIVQVMPPRLRRRVDTLQAFTVPVVSPGGPTIDAEVLSTIAQACRDDDRLKFEYTPRGGEPMLRTVEPHRLVCLGRRWYLVAYDLTRDDWRTFRVDRLSAPRATGPRFRQRELPGGDAAAFVQRAVSTVPQRHHVVVVVDAPAADVEAAVGRWGTVTGLSPGGCRLAMEVDDLGWPMMVLASIGAGFRVESPEELGTAVGRVGALFSAAAPDLGSAGA